MKPDPETNPTLGFDLGTTFSVVARWINGKMPQIIQNKVGENTTQSVVYFDQDNQELIVGKTAYNRGLISPENMVVGVKRLMGDAKYKIRLGNRSFSPIEISAMILKNILDDAKSKYPPGMFQARGSVVTVPYHFHAHQVHNTRKAAELADINCKGIIQEPIAASLFYAFQLAENQPQQDLAQTILVFDLGGGTFDLTLFRLEHSQNRMVFEVLASAGDERLGGLDFDRSLAKVILKKSGLPLEGLDEKTHQKAVRALLEHTIAAKIALSTARDYYVAIPFFLPDQHIEEMITRVEFEQCMQPYLQKMESIMESIWTRSGLRPTQVDRVIRVGGSSCIPCVRQMLDRIVGHDKVWANVNPVTCVAQGAALYSAYLEDPRLFHKEIVIHTRTTHALGIAIADNQFREIIPANQPTPCKVSQVFTTTQDNVSTLDVDIYQGQGTRIDPVTHAHVGTLHIDQLPKRTAGQMDILVEFHVDEQRRLFVSIGVEGKTSGATLNYA